MSSQRTTRKRHEVADKEEKSDRKKSRGEFNCSICLSACDDLTVLDCCSHMFCFGCIERWMLQRQTCPLCKKAVRQLKHRLKHIRKTEPSWNSDGKIETARSLIEAEDYRQLREREWPFNEEYVLISGAIDNLQMLLQDRKNWRACESIEKTVVELIDLRNRMRHMTRKEVFNMRLFRFVVYYMNADRSALIPSNSSVVLNEEYVRTNRKNLRVQWIPFVAREIRSITGLNTIDIDTLLDLIFDAMQFGGDCKLKLFARLRALGVDHPRTFFSSVHSFGSANQSMELYDACSRYEPRRGLSRVFTDDDNDDVHVVFANGDRDVEVLGTSRSRPLPVLHVPHLPPSAPPPISGRIPFISNRNLFSMPTLPHLFEYGPMSSHHRHSHRDGRLTPPTFVNDRRRDRDRDREEIRIGEGGSQDDSDIQIIEPSPPPRRAVLYSDSDDTDDSSDHSRDHSRALAARRAHRAANRSNEDDSDVQIICSR